MESTASGFASLMVILVLAAASVAIIGYVAAMAVSALRRRLRPSSPREPLHEPDPAPLPDEQIRARILWDRHEREGIVRSTGLVDDTATVVVDEDAFLSLDPSVQAGYAETLNLAALGPGRSMPAIAFMGHRANRRIALWTRGGMVHD